MRISRVAVPFVLLPVASLWAAEFTLDGRKFTVPEGFTVQRVTTTNLVQRPVSASFDDQGRLYVTDSEGSNEAPSEQLKHPGSRVLRLEDTNGDGIFDKSTVFADKVMFPQGCLWHDGWVYVAGPPSIWRFKDADGDGKAELREDWFKGGTLTGCANDIHGPYLGPEGYIYWTKGAFAEQTHKLGNGKTLNDKAAHVLRARPDGSDLDVIMTGGMDNPVEVAFTPEGETLFSSTFIDFSQPGFRDGVGHALYGGVFGKVNDVLNDGRVKRTGPDVMHPFYQAGPAAECGLTRYESEAFGRDYRDNFFASTFNLHKVTRHILRPNGATYASTDSDFLVCDDVDFHPTDVLPDADGSLLVVDTGGWYRLCCPSSQLAKPDVFGALYRVRKTNAAALAAAERGAAYRRLTGPPSLSGYQLVATVKRGIWNQGTQSPGWFVEVLSKNTPATTPESAHVARAAAEGIGRLQVRSGIPALLAALSATEDQALETSLIRALIDVAAPAETRAGLQASQTRTQRGALIALDQMDGSDLKPAEVTPSLSTSDERLRTAASWIIGRHPEWGGELAGWFRAQLGALASDATRLDPLHSQLRILTHANAGQQLLAEAITKAGFADSTRIAALNTIADAGLKEPPAVWKSAVLAALGTPKTGDPLLSAIHASRAFNGDVEIQGALLAIARDGQHSAALRLEALAALPTGATLSPDEFAFTRSQLQPAVTPTTRATAAGLLSRVKLDAAQLSTLTEAVRSAGPLEAGKLLAAFDNGGDDTLGQKLVAALRESKGVRALAPGQVRPHFAKFPDASRQSAESFLATLNTDSAKQAAHLDGLLADVQKLGGDQRRGQAVFNGSKAACSACHRIGYLGGNVGPELTEIGKARTERDLLESIVYPSASFVRSFEPTLVALKDGEQINGLVKRETPDEILLATGPGAEQRLRRSDIADTQPGTISVMPGGLDEQLTRQELADLLRFVKDVRWR